MSAFEAMRQRLIDRGLIDAGFRLTEAGNAHVDSMMVDLREVEADNDPQGSRVFWKVDFRRKGGTRG